MTRLSHEPRVTTMTSSSSHFKAYDPTLCPKENKTLSGSCGIARCVDCCGQQDDKDVIECSRCGLQRMVDCFFDEECS